MHDDQMYFAVKSIGLSQYPGRKAQTLLDAARHNLREIQAENGANGHIDPLRTSSNAILTGPSKASEVVELANQIAEKEGVDFSELRKDHCQAFEIVFSLPSQTSIDPQDYFAKCLNWTRQAYRVPVLLATAHFDEGAAHMHVLLLPVSNGAYTGCKPLERAATKVKSESFFQRVASPAGLKRSSAKLRGVAKSWGINAVLTKIEVEGLQHWIGALWPLLRTAIERDPVPALQALQIEIESIRPTTNLAQTGPVEKPIGFKTTRGKPIGFQSTAPKVKNLSCVGFTRSKPEPSHAIDRKIPRETLSTTRALRLPPEAIPDEDGIVRVRDEFCQDPDEWAE